MDNDRLLLDVAERIRTRFFGKYRGVVTQVDASTMRVKAKVPSVLGAQDTGWAMPCVPYAGPQVGFAFLPEVGSGVWVEFEGGDLSMPIWVGCYWHTGETPPEAKEDAKAIVTKTVKIILDDGQTKSTVEDTNKNTVTLDSNGIAFERNGQNVKIEAARVAVNGGALEVI
jgi:uncharacterized protein involved in type VI secretion and phage assembly